MATVPSRSAGRSGPASRSGGRSGPGGARPPALRASIAFGIVGGILLVIGFVSGATPVLVAATTAGSLSLVSALVWRAQLIEAWREENGRPRRSW